MAQFHGTPPRPGGGDDRSLNTRLPDVSVFASLTTATTVTPATLPHGLQDQPEICVWSVQYAMEENHAKLQALFGS